MSDNIRIEAVYAAFEKSYAIMDKNVHNDITKQHEFRKQEILADESLTEDERSEAISMLDGNYNFDKIRLNIGPKKFCQDCQKEYLATTYCEHCIRIYLEENFQNWTGNAEIDNLIRQCQIKSLAPNRIVEWIPYSNLQDIKYFNSGGCSEIFKATWIGGYYSEWDAKEKKLKRAGNHEIILKKLSNIESAKRNWFEEAISHLTISNKWAEIVLCDGLTQDPESGEYMIVMEQMDSDLRTYLNKNHNVLMWKKRIKIAFDIIGALYFIHEEKALHRDLHSGNVLYFQKYDSWYISDLGFCGPADKPLGAIYGCLTYIAPEVIAKKLYSHASDIYSIGMIMWEISSGYPPFYNSKYYDYDLAMNIINGMRPKIVEGTPLGYQELMKQCWNAQPSKRPKINVLLDKIEKLWKDSYNDDNIFESNTLIINIEDCSSPQSSQLYNPKLYSYSSSKVYYPEDLPNEQQEGFHSRPYDFNIPES